jgi:Helix-turn-helix domain
MEKGKVFFTERELSEMFGVSNQKLRSDRRRKLGIPYVRIGLRTIRYLRTDVERFVTENKTDCRRGSYEPDSMGIQAA